MYAQATATGSVVGVVTDASGAAVPSASVTITSKATGTQRTSATNGSGQYRFDLLPAGDYTLHVTANGFSPADTTNLNLQVGSTTTANVPLATGGVNTTVDVQTVNQLLDAEKTDSSTNVTPQQVTELPLNGRDFANLAILAPGVKLVDSYDPTKNRYAVYAVNGSSGRNTNTTVNGIDNKDNTVGGAVMQLPLEAVQEFKISTARFSAENGRSEGAALNVITKSGTNQFHGALFGFFRSDAIQNKNYFDVQSNNPKPAYSRQQYGGAIGGPIRKDKDFGFFAYEGLRERSSISVDATSFAELSAASVLGAVPAHTIPTPFDEKRYNGRIDHKFSDKELLYVSYAAQDNKSQNDQSTNQVDTTEGNFTINDLILTNVTLSSVLSNKAVNNFTAGFQYWNNLIDSALRKPYFTFPDGASFGTNLNVPQKSSQHKFQFKDDFSYSLDKHTLKMGVDYLYEPQVGGFFVTNPTPEFDFYETAQQILSNADGNTPNGFASAGAIQNSTGSAGDPTFNLSPKMVGVYFQDDWRISNRFLLNIGLRYDKDIDTYGIAKQANSRTHQELIAAAATGVATLPTSQANQSGGGYTPSLNYLGGTFTGLPQNDNKDISPRIGFSYDVSGNGRLVVRGGYGLYFGQTFENIPLFMIQQANALVFASTYSISCGGPTDTTCSSANTVPGTNIVLSRYRYGVDPFPVIPAPTASLAAGSTGRLMSPNFRNPYTQQINFGFQYAPTANSVIEAEYVQARGLHEDKTININPTQYFAGGARPFTAAFQKAGVPVLGSIREEAPIGRSYYDALNLSYRARLKKYVNATVNYTYAAALAFEGNPAAFRNTATNPFLGQLRDQDFGFAPNNETHHLTAAGTFFTKYGFEVSPILQAGASRPLDPTISTDVWGIGSGRSNAHPILIPGNKPTLANFVNAYQTLVVGVSKARGISTGAAYKQCLVNATCVEGHYNSLRGIPDIQLDARVGDTITLHDRYKLNLFFQGFNLTNRANFGSNYVGTINTYAAGSTQLKPAGFINPSSTIIPRAFTGEFGARFSF